MLDSPVASLHNFLTDLDAAQILNERPGVINMHLSTTVSTNALQMLYTLSLGPCTESSYGLQLARVVNLPPLVLEVAEAVSANITETKERKKRGSRARALLRKRKLVLGLKEILEQANDSDMQGKQLREYLLKVQREFIRRMEEIETEGIGSDEGDNADDECSSQEGGEGRSPMNEEVVELGDERDDDVDMESQPEGGESVFML